MKLYEIGKILKSYGIILEREHRDGEDRSNLNHDATRQGQPRSMKTKKGREKSFFLSFEKEHDPTVCAHPVVELWESILLF